MTNPSAFRCAALLLAAAGCSSGLTYGTGGAGTSRKTSAGEAAVTGGSSSTSAGTSSSGTTTVSGTSSGASGSSDATTSGGFNPDCATASIGNTAPPGCPAGQHEVFGQLTDYCSGSYFTGNAQVMNTADNNAIATSLACGFFSFCVNPGQTVSTHVVADGYYDVLVPTVSPTGNVVIDASPGLPMVCTIGVQGFQEQLMTPPFNPDLATLLIGVQDDSTMNSGTPGPCSDLSGWVFTLVLPDGGILPAAEAQVAGMGFDPTATATEGEGTTIFYNLDPSLQGLTFTADNATYDADGLDAGKDAGICHNLSQSEFKLSTTIPLQGSAFTFVPYSVN